MVCGLTVSGLLGGSWMSGLLGLALLWLVSSSAFVGCLGSCLPYYVWNLLSTLLLDRLPFLILGCAVLIHVGQELL
eukprot:1674038-Amphidinium_carterae.1